MACSRDVYRCRLILLPWLGVAAVSNAKAVEASEPMPAISPAGAAVSQGLNHSALARKSIDFSVSSLGQLEAPGPPFSPLSRAAVPIKLSPPQYLAQVIPSAGTTNTRVSPTAGGNTFEIDGGTQVGGNLFHRFDQLDLTAGQVARFLSDSNVEAIFSQVTGPASSLDGLLQVRGSHANLFVINPAGILLGPNAQLDLRGSFTATTAGQLGFGEQWIDLLGEGFRAETAIADSLTALEFSGGGAIANQGQLVVSTGESLGLLGHAVTNTGSLEAPGGKVTLAAAKAGQRLSLNGGLLNLAVNAPVDELSSLPLSSVSLGETLLEATGLEVNADGRVALAAGTAIIAGELDVSAPGKEGGQIKLLGDSVRLVNSVVDASGGQGGEIWVGGDERGQGTLLRARQTQVDADSMLQANSSGTGAGGRIVVWADGATQFAGIATATAQAGGGGFVETSGKQVLDVAGARVDASTLAGVAGNWLLDPTDILIQAGGGGTLAAGDFDPVTTGAASIIAPGTIETALDGGTNVTITTAGGTGGNGDITLNDPINQVGGGNASLTLTGRRFNRTGGAQINLTSTGGVTFNLNQVNGEANPSTQSIQTAIDSIGAVNGPRLITLGPGLYQGAPATDLITIGTDLTIDGLDRLQTFISGNNNARVVTIVPGITATLQRLNIQEGQTAASGAGILNQGNLSLIDVLLQNNIAGLDGGAIDSSAASSSLTTAADTVIANNQAGRNGGGLASGGSSLLEDGAFTGNAAGNEGGGIYNTGVLSLNRFGLSQNAAVQGGGVANVGSTASTTLQSFAVQNNNATGNGGGLFNFLGTIATLNGSFEINSGDSGGGIFSSGPTSLINTGFDGNQAAQEGGGAFLVDSTVDLQGLSFQNNQASGDGGGLRLFNIAATLSSSAFSNNQANFGGGLEASGSGSVTLNDVSFSENVALRLGGGLQNDDSVVLVANEPTFNRNRADLYGGAVNNNSTLTINDGEFLDNRAVRDGGGIRNLNGQLTLNQGTFRNNQATELGGAIASSDSNVSIEGATFTNNQATLGGGAIRQYLGDLVLNSAVLEGNQTDDSGGALQQAGGRLAIADSRLVSNVAQQRGGAIALDSVTDGTIEDSLMQGNQAILNGGGGILLTNSNNLDLRRLTFQQNQAEGNGGALAAQTFRNFSGNVTVEDSAFEQNRSNANGGAIHFFPNALGGQLVVEGSTLNANQAQRGGAIFTGTDATSVLRRSTISDNVAREAAGAIRSSGQLSLEHVTVSHNISDVDATGDGLGGGIWQEQGQVSLSHSIVAQNQVGNDLFANRADLAGNFQDLGNNLIGIVDGATGLTSSSLLGNRSAPLNPLLGTLGNYGGLTETRPLLPGSPAIDGAAATALPVDQRGVARVNSADVGAFESQGFVATRSVGTSQSTAVNTAFPLPLTVAVTSAFGEPVDGGQVDFAAPVVAASIAVSQKPTSVAIAGGTAQLLVSANEIEGQYDVEATVEGLDPVTFELTNLPAPMIVEPPLLLPSPPPPTIAEPVPPPPIVEPSPMPTIVEPPPLPDEPPAIAPPAPPPEVSPELPPEELPPLATTPLEEPQGFAPPNFIEPSLLSTRPQEPPSEPLPNASPLSLSSGEPLARIDADFSAEYSSHWQSAATEGSPMAQVAGAAVAQRSGDTLTQTRELLNQAETAHGVKSAVAYALFVPQDKVSDERFGQTQVASMALRRRLQTNAVEDDDLLMLVLVPSSGAPIQRLVNVTRQEVMQQARLFRMAVSDPEDEWSYRPLAQQLQSWLFAPIEPELERLHLDNVMYALAPGLRSIPLAAMMDGDEFVIERYGISLIPSVDLLETDFGSSPPPPQTLAAGANEFKQLSDLPAVSVELEAIAARRQPTEVLFNQDFTQEKLLATQAQGQAKMLHLATHGSFDAGDLSQSYLQFWDAQLTLDDIGQMGWNDLELLILSACQTAISSPEAELGFAGLAAATGVESTIGSLWTVSDLGTLGMMAEFYGQLSQQPLRFEALRKTQISMLRGKTAIANQQLQTERGSIDLPQAWQLPEETDFSHPFYWSGFTLVGNPWW